MPNTGKIFFIFFKQLQQLNLNLYSKMQQLNLNILKLKLKLYDKQKEIYAKVLSEVINRGQLQNVVN
jgi:hypothetical protein